MSVPTCDPAMGKSICGSPRRQQTPQASQPLMTRWVNPAESLDTCRGSATVMEGIRPWLTRPHEVAEEVERFHVAPVERSRPSMLTAVDARPSKRPMQPRLHVCVALVAVASLWSAPATGRASLADFERDLAALREPLDVPGMSAAIAERGKIIWSRGFGIANRERSMPAKPDTIYHLASVTKPYTATVVLQLVEERKLDLAQPVTEFGINLDTIGPGARVSHLLSHTSSGMPGTVFRYDGNAYGRLTAVVEKVTGRSFSAEVTERVIRQLGLKRTGPNPRRIPGARPPGVAPDRTFEQSGLDYRTIEGPLAMGYRRSETGSMAPMAHPT
jgi:CubicO group peptidase (beta-lactamase class C family)